MTFTAQSRAESPPRPATVLRHAAGRLAARIESALSPGGSRQDALEALEGVLERVASILDGQEPQAAMEGVAAPTLTRRLIDELVEEVVEHGCDEDAAPSLSALRALRAARLALAGSGAGSLKSRLTGPDAFELLVEAAHDLRSPLTSILFLSEALRGGHSGPVNPLQRSQLGLMYGAALGLASVASDIVDLARDGKGLIEGEPEPYAVAEVFRGVEDLVRPMAEEKRIELRIVVNEYERAHGHPVALGRVLLNLTSNALKFTDHGYVELGAERRGRNGIEYWVRDTGRGITPEMQKDLYQAFKARSDRKGHYFSGSGVGLAIARRLVRGMGGDLALESAAEWGTRFSFVLVDPTVQ